jgi:hypothetical protein
MSHHLSFGGIHMSKNETSSVEWKTIRISATSYYKLVELSGFFTVFFGSQPVPISTVADWSVTTFYDMLYSKLKEIITDPDKLEAKRKEIGGSLKRLLEVWIKPKFE